jgi:hypothetical protein
MPGQLNDHRPGWRTRSGANTGSQQRVAACMPPAQLPPWSRARGSRACGSGCRNGYRGKPPRRSAGSSSASPPRRTLKVPELQVKQIRRRTRPPRYSGNATVTAAPEGGGDLASTCAHHPERPAPTRCACPAGRPSARSARRRWTASTTAPRASRGGGRRRARACPGSRGRPSSWPAPGSSGGGGSWPGRRARSRL